MIVHEPNEGDAGTWSHCGSRRPHAAHTHTVYMNEGPYFGVLCNGAPEPTALEVAAPMTQGDPEELARLIPQEHPGITAGRQAEEAEGCPCWRAEQFDPECPLHGRPEFRVEG